MAKSLMVIARRRVAAGQAQLLHDDADAERRRGKRKAPVVAPARGRRKSDRETPAEKAPAKAKAAKASARRASWMANLPGDAVVRSRTGRGWDDWFALLDGERVAARKLDHSGVWQAARKLDPKLDEWWAQMVSVGYERARGLRELNQSCNGEFQASVSKTLPVSLDAAFAAWADAAREWLDAPGLSFTKINRGKNIRARWPDGSLIDVRFTGKGPAKVQIVADTTRLDSTTAVAAAKALWQDQFGRLSRYLGL